MGRAAHGLRAPAACPAACPDCAALVISSARALRSWDVSSIRACFSRDGLDAPLGATPSDSDCAIGLASAPAPAAGTPVKPDHAFTVVGEAFVLHCLAPSSEHCALWLDAFHCACGVTA